MKVKSNSQRSFVVARSFGICAVALAGQAAHATTKTYGGSGTLSTAASWSPSGVPITTDEALVTGTPTTPITTAAGTNLNFGDFIWNSNTSSTISLNTTGVSNTTFNMTGGGGSTAAIANGGATGDLFLLGTNAVSNTVTVTGNINSGTGTLRLALAVNGNINIVNSGATLDVAGRLSGVGGFNKTGAGTLLLGFLNSTYTGNSTLTSGTLGLGNNGALNTGTLTINGGVFASSGGSARTITNNITVGGDFALGGLGQDITLNGTMDLGAATRTITLGNTATIGGAISNGGLSVSSSSATRSLTLGTANTYSGGTTVNSGTLLVSGTSGSGAVTVKASATLGGTGSIAGATTVDLNGIQSAGTSVTLANPTATLGKETFTTGITYNAGSIFEWNLTGIGTTATPNGTRGTDFDAVNAASLATTGAGAIFRVVLNSSQDFSDAFWDTDRTWSDIFTDVAGTTPANISSIFGGGFQYQNSAGTVDPTTQGAFTISGTTLNWSAVPEPTTTLAGLLLAGGLLRRQRRTVTVG